MVAILPPSLKVVNLSEKNYCDSVKITVTTFENQEKVTHTPDNDIPYVSIEHRPLLRTRWITDHQSSTYGKESCKTETTWRFRTTNLRNLFDTTFFFLPPNKIKIFYSIFFNITLMKNKC